DPAGDADHHLTKAVLVHVVTQPELEREPHLLELVEARGNQRLDAKRPGFTRRPDVQRRDLRDLAAVACQRSAAHVAQTAAHSIGWLDVGDDERLLDPGPAGDQPALLVE